MRAEYGPAIAPQAIRIQWGGVAIAEEPRHEHRRGVRDEEEQKRRQINEVLDGLSRSNDGQNDAAEATVGARVQALCARFPLYRAG